MSARHASAAPAVAPCHANTVPTGSAPSPHFTAVATAKCASQSAAYSAMGGQPVASTAS